MSRTARRATTVLGLGATIALIAILLLWQQVDAEACTEGELAIAACANPPEPEQA